MVNCDLKDSNGVGKEIRVKVLGWFVLFHGSNEFGFGFWANPKPNGFGHGFPFVAHKGLGMGLGLGFDVWVCVWV